VGGFEAPIQISCYIFKMCPIGRKRPCFVMARLCCFFALLWFALLFDFRGLRLKSRCYRPGRKYPEKLPGNGGLLFDSARSAAAASFIRRPRMGLSWVACLREARPLVVFRAKRGFDSPGPKVECGLLLFSRPVIDYTPTGAAVLWRAWGVSISHVP
jgi:hypothetical protein